MSLPAKVLIVRLGAIGDVVNALSFAAALKAAPDPPEVGWLVHELAAPLLEGNPLVDHVHVWRRGQGLARLMSPLRLALAIREVRASGYGLAVDLQRLAKSALLARISGAPRTLGWDRARAKEGAWLWVGERLAPGDPQAHMVEHYGDFARHLGLEPCGPLGVLAPAAALCEAWRHRSEAWCGPGVVLNLGASKSPNRWPAARFGELASRLLQRGLQPILTGHGEQDEAAAAEVRSLAGERVFDLVGSTKLVQLAALFGQVRAFVGCDTGPMHMAVAMGTPVVALFGPANPRRTGPYPGTGVAQRVLQVVPPGGGPRPWRRARTESITVEAVEAALLELLEA